MGWRILKISNIAKLELKMDKLVVRYIDEQKQIFINEIDVLIIENTAVSITASLLNELLKNKVNIILCDEKRNPSATLNMLYGSHDTSDKIRKQIMWEKEIKDRVWAEIVKEKIFQQKSFLKQVNHNEYEVLENYMNDVVQGDISNREAYAAKVYFNSLFGTNFSRNYDNSINAALNYGYSIILSYINREIVANGYITQIGIHHDNQFNYYNLGCDFMEPFRVMIDRKVYERQYDKFDKDDKNEIINILNQEVIIDGKVQFLSNAINIYVKSLLQSLEKNNISLIKNYRVKE